jgi:hypothetical protein
LHRLFGRFDRLGLHAGFLGENAHACKIVLDLLKGGQNRLAIGRHARLVGGAGGLDLRRGEAAGE